MADDDQVTLLRREALPALVGKSDTLSVHAKRPRTTSKIAHIGVGGFHRSHMAYATDKLLDNDDKEQWGIVGVGLNGSSKGGQRMHASLVKQDMLYTLSMQDDETQRAVVIEAIVDYAFIEDDDAMAKLEDVKIVSLTVTEKGYYQLPDGSFDSKAARMAADIADWTWEGEAGIAKPRTAFGLICTLLARRMLGGEPAFTVLSCDNMPENGHVCKKSTLDFARCVQGEKKFAAWIAEKSSFPSTMVDRITPGTTEPTRKQLNASSGLEDEVPVIAEPFLQWVLEDAFVSGRPKWEKSFSGNEESVLLVENVTPYELMKLRLLNAGHSCLCYPALLLGHRLVDQALVNDAHLEKMLRKYFSEVAPTLEPVPGVDLKAYQESLLHRFKNSKTSDQLERIAQDGSTKFAATLTEALNKMASRVKATPRCRMWKTPEKSFDPPATAALCLACFAKALADPTAEDGAAFNFIELRQDLVEAAKAELKSEEATRKFLAVIFGEDLVDDYTPLISLVHKSRLDLQKEGGVRAALAALLD